MRYVCHPNVEAVQLDGEWTVLHVDHSTLTQFNQTGGLIWSMIQEGHSNESIIKTLTEQFDVTEEQAEGDVELFLNRLREIDVIASVE